MRSLAAPIFTQIAPLKYCHEPLALVLPPTTAMPARVLATEPVGLPPVCCWSSASEKLAVNKEETVSPAALGVSSRIVAAVWVASITVGASLTAAMLIALTSVSLERRRRCRYCR